MISKLLTLLLLVMLANAHASKDGAIESAFDVIHAMNIEAVENNGPKAERIGAYYDRHMAAYQTASSLKQYSSADIEFLFRGAFLVHAYRMQGAYLVQMRMDLDELSSRGKVPDKLLADFHASLIQARKFDEAAAFRQRHPTVKMPEVPPVVEVESEGLTALVLHDKNGVRALRREALSVSDGLRILVIAHPHCQFSKHAVHDILDDPVLGPVFRDHAVWLMPQDGHLVLSGMANWNKAYPAAPLSIAYRQSDWPMVAQWATPTFYVLDHGKPVSEITGWSRKGNRAALIAALKQAGLLK